jgi:hypothetical protein
MRKFFLPFSVKIAALWMAAVLYFCAGAYCIVRIYSATGGEEIFKWTIRAIIVMIASVYCAAEVIKNSRRHVQHLDSR